MIEPYGASEIYVGNKNNKIGVSYDGSMTLQDNYVPPVKLKDIIGGTVVTDPAMLVSVASNDPSWIDVSSTYYISIFHNWNLTSTEDAPPSGANILPIGVLVLVYDTDNKLINPVPTIQCFPDYVTIGMSAPTAIKVAIKKIG